MKRKKAPPSDDGGDLNLRRALSHPARAAIMSAFGKVKELTATDYAKQHGLPIATAVYHFRVLVDTKMLTSTQEKGAEGKSSRVFSLSETGQQALATT